MRSRQAELGDGIAICVFLMGNPAEQRLGADPTSAVAGSWHAARSPGSDGGERVPFQSDAQYVAGLRLRRDERRPHQAADRVTP